MERDYKNKKMIYHMTAMANMESIFRNGLASRKEICGFRDIADPEIITYRQQYGLTQYVPFHFFEPTPFAGAVERAHVGETFVYIALFRDYAKENGFMIIPQHPMSGEQKCFIRILDYDEGFEEIDWDLMNKRDYRDEQSKNVCMAECCHLGKINIEELANNGKVRFFVKNDNDKTELADIGKKCGIHDIEKMCLVVENMFAK